jgi:hypothetical protein
MDEHYELAPTTRMLWRDVDSVQFESGSRAVVVDGLSTRTARSLTTAQIHPDPAALPALRHLANLGLLWARGGGRDKRRHPPAPRLAAELAALSARLGEQAATAMQRRARAHVAVQGSGRVGPHLGALLAASGVGHIEFLSTVDAKLHHALPGGVLPTDESQRLAVAARAAVRRAAPGTELGAARSGTSPDLVVLAVDEPVDDDRRDALHTRGVAHLPVLAGPTAGVVGPLVLPGLTSCLRCIDLHRQDRDEAWPRLAVQLMVGRRHGPSSEAPVATIVAGSAAMQVLAYLDGTELACLDSTLELHPPDWRLRRRSWPPHPDCPCGRD